MPLLNKAVSGAYNQVSKRNDLLNGPDPRFVSYRENGKDKKIENLDLNADHCRSFIGKMPNDGTESVYSEEVITALLKYFIDHTEKDDKIVIELANAVSEVMNGAESMEGYLNFEQQKQHMLGLVKTLDKKRVKDVEIVDIQHTNKELFDLLRNQWIAGLEVPELPNLKEKLEKWELNSLTIAQHLYRVAKEDGKYLQELKGTKVGGQKERKGDSDFYTLIELAIRINALLQGVDLQGGVVRQKKYDDLLLMHINPHITKFPALQPFQQFCQEALQGKTFKGLYFDTKESEQYLNKVDKRNHLYSNIKLALYTILTAATIVVGTVKVIDYISAKKDRDLLAKQKLELFENLRVVESGDMGSFEALGEKKAETLERYENRIFERFMLRYGGIGKLSEQQFRSKIINMLNDQKILDMMGRYDSGFTNDPSNEDRFIDDHLIPKYRAEFKMNKVPILPFQNLVPYSDHFIETLNASDRVEFQLANGKVQNLSINGIPSTEKISIKKIWSFAEKYDRFLLNSFVDLYLVEYQVQWHKKQIVCSNRYYGDTEKPQEISSTTAQNMLPDFFEQAYPVIPTLLDTYLLRYYRLYSPNQRSWYYEPGFVKEKLPGNVKNLLMMDFLNKGLHTSLSSKSWEELYRYLDTFVLEHEEEIKQQYANQNPMYHSTDINSNLIPNGYLEPYEEAMKNSINASGLERLPVNHNWEANTTVKYLGVYEASDGKRYDVGVVEIDGKWYLYGNDWSYPHFSVWITYGAVEGRWIAEDYFATKDKFLKKKAELKQQKIVKQPPKENCISYSQKLHEKYSRHQDDRKSSVIQKEYGRKLAKNFRRP